MRVDADACVLEPRDENNRGLVTVHRSGHQPMRLGETKQVFDLAVPGPRAHTDDDHARTFGREERHGTHGPSGSKTPRRSPRLKPAATSCAARSVAARSTVARQVRTSLPSKNAGIGLGHGECVDVSIEGHVAHPSSPSVVIVSEPAVGRSESV